LAQEDRSQAPVGPSSSRGQGNPITDRLPLEKNRDYSRERLKESLDSLTPVDRFTGDCATRHERDLEV
jgi:hypothetical protein